MHGGRSRLYDATFRRSLVYRDNQTQEIILLGFQNFATDYYGYPADLFTTFKAAGLDDKSLQMISKPPVIRGLLMEFCPAFRQWVHQFAGEKAMELVIEYYGLYGDERVPLEKLEHNLDLNNAAGYKAWTLGKLRASDAAVALKQVASEVGSTVLRPTIDHL